MPRCPCAFIFLIAILLSCQEFIIKALLLLTVTKHDGKHLKRKPFRNFYSTENVFLSNSLLRLSIYY